MDNLRTDQVYTFNVGLAQKYGLSEAVILQNLIFWLQKNKANGRNYHDGYYWTFNSVKAFGELFPFWTDRQIRHTLEKLEKAEIIKTGNYNKHGYDRTKWYAIIDKSILQFCQLEPPKMTKATAEIVETIPDINTDSKPNNDAPVGAGDTLAVDDLYGRYPARCPIGGRSTGKSKTKNKAKIKTLLKTMTAEEIGNVIDLYLADCKATKTFVKNFATFLNNLPDVDDLTATGDHVDDGLPWLDDSGEKLGLCKPRQ